MAFPVTLNGTTYTLSDFEGLNYVDGFPDALEDFVTEAGTKVTAAEAAQTAAETAQAAAEAALDSFDDRFLGSKSTDPTLDNDGNALTDGALYFDTTNNVMKVYDLGNTEWKQTTPTSAQQSNIDSVATNETNINTVAAADSNISTVVTNISNINTVAAADANITTVAGANANISTVASADANIATVATNISDVNSFAETYRIASSAPTSSLDEGDLYYNTTSDKVQVYNGSSWQDVAPTATSITVSQISDLTANAGELNVLDGVPGTLTATEIGYLDGVTSSIQTQIDTVAAEAGNSSVDLAITETIAAGDAMQLNSDGSIDKVLEQIVATTQNVSLSVADYSSGALSNPGKKVLKFVPDDPSRFVAIYRDDGNNGYPTAVAGSISGTTITLGTPTIIRSSNTSYDGIDFDFDPNDTTSLTVIYYNAGGDTNDITEITLSGTAITASGSYTSFSDYSRNEGCCIKFVPGSANPGYFVISGKYSFISGVGSDRRSTRVGVLSNGSYTLGAEYEFDTTTDNALNDNIAFLPSDSSKFVLAYQDTSNDYVKLAVLSINFSAKTLSAGTPLIAEDDSGNTYPGRSGSVICAIDPTSNHVLLSVVNIDFDLLCAGFSISGTTLTQVANATDIDTTRNSSRMGLGIDKSYGSGKMVLCYSHNSPTDTIRTSIVKYTSSTGAFAIQNSVNSTYTYDNNYHTADVSQDGSGIFLSFYKSGSEGHLNLGRLGVDVTTSNLDTAKLHGIAQEAGVNGNSISVAFAGIDETQTGMTPGSSIYIQGDGSLGTTSTDAKKIGRAITATKLIMDGSQ